MSNFNSEERCHRLFLEGMKKIGLGSGEKGWIEHDVSGKTQRDSFSLEGEIHFGFEAIAEEIEELKNAARMAERYDDLLRDLFFRHGAGGYNDEGGLMSIERCKSKLEFVEEEIAKNAVMFAKLANKDDK